MNNFGFYIFEAVKLVLKDGKLFTIFLVFSGILFAIMFSIPLNSIPGNDIKFQIVLFGPRDYALLGLLSLLSALTITIQADIFRKKLNSSRSSVALGGAGVFSGVFSSIFASATCALCLGSLFSFLGFGTILFLVENRWYILIGATVLLFISLYLVSKQLVDGCESCRVPQRGV